MRSFALIGAGMLLLLAVGCAKKDADTERTAPSPSITGEATASVSATPAATASSAAGKLKLEEVADALAAGEYGRIYAQCSAEFRKQVSVSDLKQGVQDFAADVKSWKPHTHLELNGQRGMGWISEAGDKGFQAIMDEKGEFTSLLLKIVEAHPETDGKLTEGTYALPLKGEWLVVWGGNDVLLNYHYEHDSQRYAYDILRVKEGRSYEGDAKKNESYYAFGQEIVAPADGKVAHVTSDIEDNVPGVENAKQVEGNYVVIDHGNGEYSHMAHMKKGSAKVKVGDRVKRGDVIGLVGNSGNSTEPHLHFQISTGVDLFQSESIAVRFEGGLKPVLGDIVKGDS